MVIWVEQTTVDQGVGSMAANPPPSELLPFGAVRGSVSLSLWCPVNWRYIFLLPVYQTMKMKGRGFLG